MPMLDIQRRHAEVFRLRFGDRGPDGYPRKLTEAIRVTAPTEQIVTAFADTYGGDVSPFTDKASRDRYQAYLPTTSVAIMVLPGQSLQQWWERYRGSVCDRRCDGETETKSGKACQCPLDIDARIKDKQACAPTTRVSVLCPDVAVVGSGSFVTHGLIAAETLPQSIAVAEAALSRGLMVPATLTVSEVRGRNHFIYPQIVITGMSLHQLIAGGVNVTGEIGSTAGEREVLAGPQAALPRAHLTPVPTGNVGAGPSVAEQVASVNEPTPRAGRANAAEPLRSTGLKPRTAVEAASDEPAPHGEPEPTPPLAYNAGDVGKRAGKVFAADYEAAPRGKKSLVVDRLRHGAVWAATGARTHSARECDPSELARVMLLLDEIANEKITYDHNALDDGAAVSFTRLRPGHPEGDKTVTVMWSEFEAADLTEVLEQSLAEVPS